MRTLRIAILVSAMTLNCHNALAESAAHFASLVGLESVQTIPIGKIDDIEKGLIVLANTNPITYGQNLSPNGVPLIPPHALRKPIIESCDALLLPSAFRRPRTEQEDILWLLRNMPATSENRLNAPLKLAYIGQLIPAQDSKTKKRNTRVRTASRSTSKKEKLHER